MALTEAQKIKIRKYLGWPGYKTWSTKLESIFDLVDATASYQTEVELSLSNLATIETELLALHPLALAGKAEESTLNPNRYRDLCNAGARECNQLACLLGTDVERNVFSTGFTGGSLGMG